MQRWLIVFGIVLLAAGLLWPWLDRLGLGRLPGDLVVERESFRLYIPRGTSRVVRVVLTVVLWLANR